MTGPGLHLFSLNYKPVCFLSICSTPFSDLDRDSKALIFTEMCIVCLLFPLMFLFLYHPLPIPISFSLGFGGPQRGPWASFSLPFPHLTLSSLNEMLMQHPSYFIEKFHAQSWHFPRDSCTKRVSCNCHVFSLKDWWDCMCALLRGKKTPQNPNTLALVNKEPKCPRRKSDDCLLIWPPQNITDFPRLNPQALISSSPQPQSISDP